MKENISNSNILKMKKNKILDSIEQIINTKQKPAFQSMAVNGKIDMGTRKLKAAYVENATTLYAYLEADFHVLKEYMDTFSEVYKTASEIDDKIIEGEIYLIYSDKDKCAARARIEQPKAGPAGTKVNF